MSAAEPAAATCNGGTQVPSPPWHRRRLCSWLLSVACAIATAVWRALLTVLQRDVA